MILQPLLQWSETLLQLIRICNLIDSLSVYFFKSHLILHMFLHALWAGLKGKLDVLGNLNLNQDTNGHVSV